jgi:hypothetical protein
MAKTSPEKKTRVVEIVDDSKLEQESQSDEGIVDDASSLAEFDADLDFLLSTNSSHDHIVINESDVSGMEHTKSNRSRGPRTPRRISVKDVTKDLNDIMFSDSDNEDEKTPHQKPDKVSPNKTNGKGLKKRSDKKSKSPLSSAKKRGDKTKIFTRNEEASEYLPNQKLSTNDDFKPLSGAPDVIEQTNGQSKRKNDKKQKSKHAKDPGETSNVKDKEPFTTLPFVEIESVPSKPNDEKPKKKRNKKSKSKSKQDVDDKADVLTTEQGSKESEIESQPVVTEEVTKDKPNKENDRKTKSKSDRSKQETKSVEDETESEKSLEKETGEINGTRTTIDDSVTVSSSTIETKTISETTNAQSNFARLRSMFENQDSVQDFKFLLKSTKRESLPKVRPVKTIQGLDHLQILKLNLNDIKIKTIVGSSSISKYGKTGLKFTLKETDSLFENNENKQLFILLCIHVALYEASGYKMISAKYPDVDEIFGKYDEINLLHTHTKITKSPKKVHKNNLDYSILAYFGHIFLWAGSIQEESGLEPFYQRYDSSISADTIHENIGGTHLWDKLTATNNINSKRWKHINKFRVAFPFEIDQFMLILRLMKIDLNLESS